MTSSTEPTWPRRIAWAALLSVPPVASLAVGAPIGLRAPVGTGADSVVQLLWLLGRLWVLGFLFAVFTGFRADELGAWLRFWIRVSLVAGAVSAALAILVVAGGYLTRPEDLLVLVPLALTVYVCVRVFRRFNTSRAGAGEVVRLNRRYFATATAAAQHAQARGGGSARAWIRALILWGVIFGAVVGLQYLPSGTWPSLPPLDGVGGLVLLYLGFALFLVLIYAGYRLGPRRRWEQRVAEAFLAPDASAVVELMVSVTQRRSPNAPDLDASLAAHRALNHGLYGEIAAARAALDAIDWERRAPAVQAQGLLGEAQLALLCTGDAARGLALARRADALRQSTQLLARWVHARGLIPALVGLGEVLCGEADDGTLDRLRRLSKKGLGQGTRSVAARALYLPYDAAGDRAAAAAMRQRLERTMPHCAPLLAEPGGPPAVAEWARDPGEPSRAVLANAWVAPEAAPGARSGAARSMRTVVFWALLAIMFLTFFQLLQR